MDIRIGGAWQSPSAADAYVNGAWRSLQYGEAYISGAWQTIANFTPPGPSGGGGGTLSSSFSDNPISATGTNVTSLTTNAVTIIPSGGAAPYSYAWSIDTDDGLAAYAITAPNAATTAVSASAIPSGTRCSCSINCVVTDSLGVSATSADVTANFFSRSST